VKTKAKIQQHNINAIIPVAAYDYAPKRFGAAAAQTDIDQCRANRDKSQALLAQRMS
jgi:hypothetical protein